MRTVLSILGIGAALVLCAVSAAMNYLFLASLGKTPLEGQVLGAASAAADVLKALLPFFIAWSWQARRFVATASGTVAFLFFAGFSLLSALGFAADTRGTLVQSREELSAAYAGIQSAIEDLDSKRRALPTHRPRGVVREDIARHQQDRRWSGTKACTDATQNESRVYCAGHFALRAELAAAEEALRLERDMTTLQTQAVTLRDSGAAQDSDPQVSLLSRITGAERNSVRLWLTIAIALLVEIGASLGLFLASGHRIGAQASITASAPHTDRALTTGSIEDFALEALVASPRGALSEAALFEAYRAWCNRSGLVAAEQAIFAKDFAALAQAVNLPHTGDGYRGIALAGAEERAAA